MLGPAWPRGLSWTTLIIIVTTTIRSLAGETDVEISDESLLPAGDAVIVAAAATHVSGLHHGYDVSMEEVRDVIDPDLDDDDDEDDDSLEDEDEDDEDVMEDDLEKQLGKDEARGITMEMLYAEMIILNNYIFLPTLLLIYFSYINYLFEIILMIQTVKVKCNHEAFPYVK